MDLKTVEFIISCFFVAIIFTICFCMEDLKNLKEKQGEELFDQRTIPSLKMLLSKIINRNNIRFREIRIVYCNYRG